MLLNDFELWIIDPTDSVPFSVFLLGSENLSYCRLQIIDQVSHSSDHSSLSINPFFVIYNGRGSDLMN